VLREAKLPREADRDGMGQGEDAGRPDARGAPGQSRGALQYALSVVFIVQMYVAMGVMGLLFLPLTFVSRDRTLWAVHTYTAWVRWTARRLVGLRTEVRGAVPDGEVLIASKHQSFLDIILIVDATRRPKFIMKSSLRWAPVLGWYALRIGCVPVDRGKRAQAIEQMKAGVSAGAEQPGQLVIYPQGTRVAPGVARPYKVGAGVLYQQLGEACYPAATNVGVFWPRHGIYRKPGLAVVEFLPPIPPGLGVPAFMAELERVIEAASDRLLDEAGFRRGD
jgi:1-acyl-sn-glycerol-3-phosphate acyltransferase